MQTSSLVAITICSRGELSVLRRCLDSIIADARFARSVRAVSVILLDNSADGRCRPLFDTLLGGSELFAETIYGHERKPGFSEARNAAVDLFLTTKINHLLFVDDDQYCGSGFIDKAVDICKKSELRTLTRTQLIINGKKIFGSRGIKEGCGTGGLILPYSCFLFRSERFYFEKRFNTVGGEDMAFTGKLVERGYQICLAEDLVLNEEFSTSRAIEKSKLSFVAQYSTSKMLVREYVKGRPAALLYGLQLVISCCAKAMVRFVTLDAPGGRQQLAKVKGVAKGFAMMNRLRKG